jgi:hypothetical protein
VYLGTGQVPFRCEARDQLAIAGTGTMPEEAVMTRNTLLARCSTAAAAATMLVGLAAAPAIARPDSGGSEPQQVQQDSGATKAQIEHEDQLYLDGRTKAQIEHDEMLSVPSTGGDSASTTSTEEFPWAVASLTAAGIAAVAAGGVMVVHRQRKTALAST